jgi:hypothetical protein
MAQVMAACLMAAFTGCASINPAAPPTPQAQAKGVEPILTAAGFQQLPARTPEQLARLESLPALKVNYYVDQRGQAHYWLADPDYCHCIFHGDEAAYQRYEGLKLQNQMATQDQGVAAYQMQRQSTAPPMGIGFGGGGFGFSGGGFGIAF